MKIDRQNIYDKCGGRCGYCGSVIDIKSFQIDHMKPKCNGGTNDYDNLLPTCRQCNHYKRAMHVEGFRILMRDLHLRIQSVYIHRVAVNFGMANIKPFDGVFYFEKILL